ncbi:hypothetical protein NMY22_g12520 [Coprinellus aureogranulatus]|nr:hypothetical protein NMY22_g12520 [Coprinellus aureogranulatus]
MSYPTRPANTLYGFCTGRVKLQDYGNRERMWHCVLRRMGCLSGGLGFVYLFLVLLVGESCLLTILSRPSSFRIFTTGLLCALHPGEKRPRASPFTLRPALIRGDENRGSRPCRAPSLLISDRASLIVLGLRTPIGEGFRSRYTSTLQCGALWIGFGFNGHACVGNTLSRDFVRPAQSDHSPIAESRSVCAMSGMAEKSLPHLLPVSQYSAWHFIRYKMCSTLPEYLKKSATARPHLVLLSHKPLPTDPRLDLLAVLRSETLGASQTPHWMRRLVVKMVSFKYLLPFALAVQTARATIRFGCGQLVTERFDPYVSFLYSLAMRSDEIERRKRVSTHTTSGCVIADNALEFGTGSTSRWIRRTTTPRSRLVQRADSKRTSRTIGPLFYISSIQMGATSEYALPYVINSEYPLIITSTSPSPIPQVPQKPNHLIGNPAGGHTVYYINLYPPNERVTAFPKGFRMITGNPMIRTKGDRDINNIASNAITFRCWTEYEWTGPSNRNALELETTTALRYPTDSVPEEFAPTSSSLRT